VSIQNILYKLRLKIRLPFLQQSWLNVKKDRAKVLFGLSGITISIILLTAIGMINDSMSYNYMGIITSTTGSSDILISRAVNTDLTFDPFFDESIIENELSNIEGVDELFPRIMMLVKVSSDNTDSNGSLQVYGIDFLKEANNGEMGNLNIVDQNGTETGRNYLAEPNM